MTEILSPDIIGSFFALTLYLVLMITVLGVPVQEREEDNHLAHLAKAVYQWRKRLTSALGLGRVAKSYGNALQDLNRKARNRYSWGG